MEVEPVMSRPKKRELLAEYWQDYFFSTTERRDECGCFVINCHSSFKKQKEARGNNLDACEKVSKGEGMEKGREREREREREQKKERERERGITRVKRQRG